MTVNYIIMGNTSNTKNETILPFLMTVYMEILIFNVCTQYTNYTVLPGTPQNQTNLFVFVIGLTVLLQFNIKMSIYVRPTKM